MILGVKKRNFFLYFICFIVGLFFLTLPFFCSKIYCIKDVFIGLGCSFIPSSLTAFFLDRVNIKAENNKRQRLRNTFSYGMKVGIYWVAKIIIEEFYVNDKENDSFLTIFEESVNNAENIKYEIKDAEITCKKRMDIVERLSYGLSLCIKDSNLILQNKIGLIENNIFTNDEISNIQCILQVCMEIPNISSITIMIEEVQNLINYACVMPEVGKNFQKQILISKSKIKNWNKII